MTGDAPIRLYVHVEEPSMNAALDALLPKLLERRTIVTKIIDHGSKQGLLANLPHRLRGYQRWTTEDIRVLVLVDRDDDECHQLKQRLEAAASGVGFATKTAPDIQGDFRVVNRIVVEELEAWFLGDEAAVCKAFPGVPKAFAAKSRYRDPDAVKGGTWEALAQLLARAGYYQQTGRIPKIEVARRVAAHMSTSANRSHSFRMFVTGLEALLA